MALESIYRCLDVSLEPPELLQNLVKAIAQEFSFSMVHLRLGTSITKTYSAHWSQGTDGSFDPQIFAESQSKKSSLWVELEDTSYSPLLKQGIQEVARLIIPEQLADSDLHIGASSSLPSMAELEAKLLPPLQLAGTLLSLHHSHRQHETKDALLAQINQIIDMESNINKLLTKAIAASAKYFDVDLGFAGLFKYVNPLLARNDQATCPEATLTIIEPTESTPEQIALKECFICEQAWFKAPSALAIDDYSRPPCNVLTETYKSFLVAPLMGQRSSDGHSNIVLGLLFFAQSQPRAWQPAEKQFAEFLAHQLSTAMIHQQSLRQVQSLVDERTAQLKWSLDVQAKLGAKMRQQIQQLRQLNVLKDEFLSTMSHELNTPLATMKVAVKMLKQPGRSPEKQATYLDILDQELVRESKLIKDLLKLQHFESEQFALKPQRLELNPILEKMQNDFNRRWQLLKGLQLEVVYIPENISQKLQIETDEESLTNALSELLVNAGKYSVRNSIVKLEVEYFAKTPAQVQLRICNDGAGISEEEQGHIFEKFRRGAGVTDKAIPGTGLGLALVKALVEQLEGSIEVSSEPNHEKQDEEVYCTCFTLTFPQSMVGL